MEELLLQLLGHQIEAQEDLMILNKGICLGS